MHNQSGREERIFGRGWIISENGKLALLGSCCQNCRSYWFPKREICPDCFSDKLKEVTLSRVAEVYSYSIIHAGPKGFKTPYMIAYVDFPEGVRICAQVEGWESEPVTCGTRVEVVYGCIRQDPDQTPVFSYKFKPLAKGREE